MNLLLINGPNLNLLGKREPIFYGSAKLEAIEADLRREARQRGARLDCFQSNSEGALVDRIQAALEEQCDGVLINAGAYTHTSIAIRDALLAIALPFVELHMSNVYSREPFRQRSLLVDCAVGVVSGFGALSYRLALEGLLQYLHTSDAKIKSGCGLGS